ncbi:MAG: hypothetical protein HUU56_04990 [Bdellovibrionaceae bacterium]|nr:hypothetical protein [Pseudobdellovibrionaceae bacterium]
MQQKNSESRRPHKEASATIVNTTTPIKEEKMAAKEFTTENPLLNYAGQAQDAWKEIYNYQVKTSQHLMDQMMKWGQTYSDFTYTQFSEANKISQEMIKSGMTLTEDLRKGLYSLTEKMTKNS